jgi:ATP-dependent exoDNAse (exonuclease V) beta subunit
VGDPKQSIYAWRNADPKAYDDFVDHVRREGGELLRLTVNFRSAPTILEEVQRVVAPVMHQQKGLQPAFEPLIPCPDRAGDKGFVQQLWAPVEYWISWVSDEENPPNFKATRSAEAVELEACALARDIVRLNREQNVAFRDIAVLFRSTGDMDRYLTAFRESGIPYAVSRDKNYYRRREIIEATALVRCILDPNDHLALLTLMRSPTVGVPDAALIPLWTRSFPAVVTELRGADPDQIQRLRILLNEVVDTLPEGIPGLERVRGWEKNLLTAIRNLALLRESFEREPFDIFVERIRTHFLVEATEAARYLGPFRLANLERFFHGLIETVEEAGGDTQMILRSLRTGVAQLREAEEGRPKEAAEDAVQVMTIHKAKGLDFKHVYVMQLHRGSRSDSPPTTAGAIEEGSCDYTLFGTCTPGYMKVREHRTAVQTAELVRTLYVAMTRAKDRLVLAGNWPFMMTRKAPSKAKTHMDLLQWRSPSPPRLMDLMQQLRKSSQASWIDHAETRWFFPGVAQNGDTEIAPLEMMADFPSVEQISAEAAALASRVQASRTHAARPFTAAASQESHEALQELFLQHPAVQGPSDDKQRLAMAVGSALHFVLEAFDLNAELIVEVERQRARLDAQLRLLLSPQHIHEAQSQAKRILDRFVEGNLLRRLREISDHIIARELPVLLPPTSSPQSPVGVVVGAIDLLYRDPQTGAFVIADYKTDEIQTKTDIVDRTRVYSLQVGLYVTAVKEALNLAEDPTSELWFLQFDHIEAIR